MIGFLSKLFGGSKSEKDVKSITPFVAQINQNFQNYQSLSNDELRNKTVEFRQRIKEHIKEIDAEIEATNKSAEELPFNDLVGKDTVYQQVDKLRKERNEKIEEALKELLPEAFAVVKETARRFKENSSLTTAATDLDRELAVQKPYNGRRRTGYLEHVTLRRAADRRYRTAPGQNFRNGHR
jgi:preprotein translocase subunit SecA